MISLGPDDIPTPWPRLASTGRDGRPRALSLVTGHASASRPRFQALRRMPADALRTGGRSASAGRARSACARCCRLAEVALYRLVLLIRRRPGAAQSCELTAVDPVFDADGPAQPSVRSCFPSPVNPDSASMTAVADRIAERVAGFPA
jgi:hypothetical protein